MTVYTKVKGKLSAWQIETSDYEYAIKLVRNELGAKHKSAILALVKG